MSRHLSSDQKSRWVLGERGAAEEAHVRECSECRGELVRLESVLEQFRSSVHRWGDVQAAVESSPWQRDNSWRPGRWVLAAATLLILVTLPVFRNARERKRAEERAQADAILIERVDRAVSRTVPRPMEPLIELVAGEEGNERKP
jgi:hypothetical protein